jgi:phosphoglycolate phosphatase
MTLDISRIQAICFDSDGTLRDTDDQYAARVNSLLRPLRFLFRRGTERTARRLVMAFEGPVNDMISLADKLGLDGPLHRLFEVANPWKNRHSQVRYLLVPGAEAALEALHAAYPLALVTARGSRGTLAFLEQTGIFTRFHCIATALTSPRGKPSPDPILWAAQQLGLPPENCVMVGDTVVDMLAGKAAGAQAVGVLSGFGEESELLAAGADLILPSVADLPGVLGIKSR